MVIAKNVLSLLALLRTTKDSRQIAKYCVPMSHIFGVKFTFQHRDLERIILRNINICYQLYYLFLFSPLHNEILTPKK